MKTGQGDEQRAERGGDAWSPTTFGRKPGLQMAAIAVLVLVALVLAGLGLVVGSAFSVILTQAEEARHAIVPSITQEQQQAVLAAQLSRQAEVILNSRDRAVRSHALDEADRLAGRFAAVVDLKVLDRLDSAVHAVRRSAYRADLLDALYQALRRNVERSHAALNTAAALPLGSEVPLRGVLSAAFRLHWLLTAADSADPETVIALETEYRQILSSQPAAPAATEAARLLSSYRELAGTFEVRREILRVQGETARDTANAHDQLKELTEGLSAEAAARTRSMADEVLAHSERGVVVSVVSLAITAAVLVVVAAMLRQHVLLPVRRASEALETVRNERRQVTLPSAMLREFDDFSRLVESFSGMMVELQSLAHNDPLTNLANRRLFTDHLAHALALAERGSRMAALMYFDLDGFKQVNDTYGHRFGDRLLVEAAKRIRTCVRSSDLVARVGGDEFTVVLENLQDPQDVTVFAQRLIEALSKPFMTEGARIGVSIGITLFPGPHGDTPESLVHKADQAMYIAKRTGKGRYVVWSEPEVMTA